MASSEKVFAFDTLLLANRRKIAAVASAYARSPGEQADLMAGIRRQIWRSFGGRAMRRASSSTWIYRIALNVASAPPSGGLQRGPGPEQRLGDEARDRAALDAFIQRQDALHKAVMVLFLDDLRIREIAEVLGISEPSVAARIAYLEHALHAQIRRV